MAPNLRLAPNSISLPARTLLRPRAASLPFSRAFTNSQLSSQAATDSDEHPSNQREAQKDRHKMDTQPNEYAKSGTDADTAAQDDAAFNPNSPSNPQDAKEVAGKGNKVNPLDVSPANPELSQGTSESDQSKEN